MTNIPLILNQVKKVKFAVGIAFIMSLLFAFHPADIFACSEVKIGEKFPNFVLEGADGNQYELEQMKGKVIILVMGPRDQTENNTKWAELLKQTFQENDSLEVFSVFDMRGIPFFISKGFVRGKVKEKQEKPYWN